jgi:hypothetical protein
VQELLALMIFKHRQSPMMEGKPVVIYNRRNAAGLGFWDPLITLLRGMSIPGDFVVVEELEEILPAIQPGMKKRRAMESAPLAGV